MQYKSCKKLKLFTIINFVNNENYLRSVTKNKILLLADFIWTKIHIVIRTYSCKDVSFAIILSIPLWMIARLIVDCARYDCARYVDCARSEDKAKVLTFWHITYPGISLLCPTIMISSNQISSSNSWWHEFVKREIYITFKELIYCFLLIFPTSYSSLSCLFIKDMSLTTFNLQINRVDE